ncbi:helix-turn-helix domain-containing protein, partial [Pseudomonas protegens]|uniref:helix-turn-helix domain-containing protein n=1 Tax=Pseudomonas protegens TaxID=380021 RepID=UPI0034D6EBB7
ACVERAALLSMGLALQRPGLFESAGQSHALDEIVEACEVAPRNQRLIRRWLQALAREGLVHRDLHTGRYSGLQVSAEEYRQQWQRIDALEPSVGWGAEVLRYLRESQEQLPALMSDQLDPLHLLFPQGRTDTAEGAYRKNLISQYLNQAVCAAVQEIIRQRPAGQRLRLLGALTPLEQGERVTDVALACGYDSTSAFIAAFRQQFDATPGEFFRDL